MNKKPWAQELMWVQRNEDGVIVGVSDQPPKTGDFIPTLPAKEKGPIGVGADRGRSRSDHLAINKKLASVYHTGAKNGRTYSMGNNTPVKGYKVFNPDFTCRGFQYVVGKTYTLDGTLRICDNGYHFCEQVANCFNYYDFDPNNRVAEIEALGEVRTDDDKSVTNIIRIVREISWAEMLDLANQGKGNTGRGNAGNRNTGHYNAGHYNTGHYNAGNRNAGDSNAGNRNAGDSNAGDSNAGDSNAGDSNAGNRNTGDSNTGDFNSCNYSSGTFCSEEPPFLLFNKPSPISREELRWHHGMRAARQLRVVDGEGNKVDYKQAWSNLWNDELGNPERIAIQSLPNFDADVFFDITGIRV